MESGRRWAVTTWNVLGSRKPDLDAIAAAVRERSPDAVAVQEIRRSQARRLAAALSMRHAWALKHYPYTFLLWWSAEGMAILTVHAVAGSGSTQISGRGRRWDWRRRIVQWCHVVTEDGDELVVYNLHLSPHEDAAGRHAEAERAAALIAAQAHGAPVVIAGDLNDDGDPSIIATLPGEPHVEAPPTNPSEAPTKALDHVLAPPEAVDVTVEVPPGGASWMAISDHLPLTVTFRM